VAPDGSLYMLDKFGYMFKAERSPTQRFNYTLQPGPVAYVGPGRPLGFHFDSAGNLIICDSLKAGANKLACSNVLMQPLLRLLWPETLQSTASLCILGQLLVKVGGLRCT
jgi:hypothetical protein